jgi:pheromone shutdown protein TraB
MVEHLWMSEAQTEAAMAHLLKVSIKTIQRDKDVIRKRNAERLTPEGKSKIIGELLGKLTSTHENLMRLARSKDGSIQETAQAGSYATSAILEMGKMLQSLGYLDSAGQKIDVSIREEEPTPSKLKEELARLEKIVSGKNVSDPEVTRLMEEMRYHIAIAEAKERLVKLEGKISDITKDKDSSGE